MTVRTQNWPDMLTRDSSTENTTHDCHNRKCPAITTAKKAICPEKSQFCLSRTVLTVIHLLRYDHRAGSKSPLSRGEFLAEKQPDHNDTMVSRPRFQTVTALQSGQYYRFGN